MTLARSILVPALVLVALAGVARAQTPAPPGPRAQEDALCLGVSPVSYTHLTLPTICSV